MTNQLNLADIQKDLGLIKKCLKVGIGHSGEFKDDLDKVKRRLFESKKSLHEYLKVADIALCDLEKTSSDKLHNTKQAVATQIDKIKDLISEVNLALNYCHSLDRQPACKNRADCFGEYKAIKKDVKPISAFYITSQTIQLLDIEMYGSTDITNNPIEFPKPDIGLVTNQRNCSIADKIHIGSDNFNRKNRQVGYRIDLPIFYRSFCRKKN